jgi:adenosylcobinamide-GDP ribazoletransferase
LSAVRGAGIVTTALATPVGEIAAALSFLTRLPGRTAGDRSGSVAFALVGGLIGIAATWPLAVFGSAQPLVSGVVVVATVALVSGALHLDGLADTADALATSEASASERARLDPAAGPAGVTAICTVLLLDSALVAALIVDSGPLAAGLALIVAGATSRAAPVIATLLARGRVRPGLAAWFAARTGVAAMVVCVVTSIVAGIGAAAAFAAPAPLIAALGGLIGAVGLAGVLIRARHGLDGDALGAIVESTFTLCLLVALASTSLLSVAR